MPAFFFLLASDELSIRFWKLQILFQCERPIFLGIFTKEKKKMVFKKNLDGLVLISMNFLCGQRYTLSSYRQDGNWWLLSHWSCLDWRGISVHSWRAISVLLFLPISELQFYFQRVQGQFLSTTWILLHLVLINQQNEEMLLYFLGLSLNGNSREALGFISRVVEKIFF